jgi:hypothetical protein
MSVVGGTRVVCHEVMQTSRPQMRVFFTRWGLIHRRTSYVTCHD